MSLIVKICGITRPEDAAVAEQAGADWIGINFWPRSKRFVTIDRAKEIQTRLKKVGVFVNAAEDEIQRTVDAVGLDLVQLHGDEPPRFWPGAIRALRVDASLAARLPQFDEDVLLLDAPSEGYGGAGEPFDWAVVRDVKRKFLLAGGLTPANVAAAIRATQPFGVDVASGVESSPGIKDPDKIRAFVAAARSERPER